jgi:RNA polymerase sigma-70 factor (ECF subfamily)
MQDGSSRNTEFEEIVNRHHRRILSIAYRMLGSMEEAKDMAQETFIRLWKFGSNLQEEKTVFGFLARTVTNLCIDQLRNRKRWSLFSLDSVTARNELISLEDPSGEASKKQLVQHVLTSADKLKPMQKAVFVLRDMEGCSVKETAHILDCSENNVLVTLHKARKNLKKWLKPILGEFAAIRGNQQT